MGRFGIEFVASPRHADGIVITGPITENMAQPLQICYDAIPEPKIIILAGTDAISGGIFEGSPALNRSFLSKYKIDLYVPGNPIHPLTFINGILELIKKENECKANYNAYISGVMKDFLIFILVFASLYFIDIQLASLVSLVCTAIFLTRENYPYL